MGGRSDRAFGRRGNNIPSLINGVITLAWIGLNTYVVLSLATYCLHKLGLPDNLGRFVDTPGLLAGRSFEAPPFLEQIG